MNPSLSSFVAHLFYPLTYQCYLNIHSAFAASSPSHPLALLFLLVSFPPFVLSFLYFPSLLPLLSLAIPFPSISLFLSAALSLFTFVSVLSLTFISPFRFLLASLFRIFIFL